MLLLGGREEEAYQLMEQIGCLDRMDRELRKSITTKTIAAEEVASPLSRKTMDLATSAAVLRNAIESRSVMRTTKDISAQIESPKASQKLATRRSPRHAKKSSPRGGSDFSQCTSLYAAQCLHWYHGSATAQLSPDITGSPGSPG